MKDKKLLKTLQRYCDRIRHNNKHYVCYPKGSDKVITVSASSSDKNAWSMIYRDFRRIGIEILELKVADTRSRKGREVKI